MKILFLDCETSDVTPLTGQVIEVGGIVAQIDLSTLQIKATDQFESLVRHRKTFDDKITRITGITETELANSPRLVDAQESWTNWLESYEREVVAICGHSINFDLSFLRSESWFLPEEAKIIDTLSLAKILFPQFSAINLEYLIEKLNLLEFFNEEHAIDSPDYSQAHRALFDTWCSASLLQSQLRFLKNHPFAVDFYNFLKHEILPLGLDFYENNYEVRELKTSNNLASNNYITWKGEKAAISNSERFNTIATEAGEQEVKSILGWLQSDLNTELKIILGTIYVGIIYKHQKPGEHLKLHVYTNLEKSFVQIVLELLDPEEKVSHLPEESVFVLSQFENILWQIKNISEEVINLGDLMLLLEIYQKLDEARLNQEVANILSSYDFFLLTMEAHWASNRYQYWYRPRDMLGKEEVIKTKFARMLDQIINLSLTKVAVDKLRGAVVSKIQEFLSKLQELEISAQKKYYFRFVNQKFVFSFPKTKFTLADYLESLFLTYPSLEIKTYLSPDWFETLLKTASIGKLVGDYKIRVKYLNDVAQTHIVQNQDESLFELLQARQLMAVETQKPVLILTGNNSALRKVQKILTDDFPSSDYLTLGESGSLTKIASKLTRGFVGIFHVRIGDFGFLNFQKNMPEFAEIWLIDHPYIFVQDYWQNLAKQNSEPQLFIKTIQDINLHAQTGFIFHETGQVVRFLPLSN